MQQKNCHILLVHNPIQHFHAPVYATKQKVDLSHKNIITDCEINRYKAFFVAQKIQGQILRNKITAL
jgi:hypothetical protein